MDIIERLYRANLGTWGGFRVTKLEGHAPLHKHVYAHGWLSKLWSLFGSLLAYYNTAPII